MSTVRVRRYAERPVHVAVTLCDLTENGASMARAFAQTPTRATASPVRVRSIMPEVDADEPAVNPNAKPLQQIDGKVPYKGSYEMVTPEQAIDLI